MWEVERILIFILNEPIICYKSSTKRAVDAITILHNALVKSAGFPIQTLLPANRTLTSTKTAKKKYCNNADKSRVYSFYIHNLSAMLTSL